MNAYYTPRAAQGLPVHHDTHDVFVLQVSGEKRWGGWLAQNPVKLRDRLGGRWLTGDFRAGDVLIFGMDTIHASLDNQTDALRLSCDSRYQLASEPADPRWVGENPVGHTSAGKQGRIC